MSLSSRRDEAGLGGGKQARRLSSACRQPGAGSTPLPEHPAPPRPSGAPVPGACPAGDAHDGPGAVRDLGSGACCMSKPPPGTRTRSRQSYTSACSFPRRGPTPYIQHDKGCIPANTAPTVCIPADCHAVCTDSGAKGKLQALVGCIPANTAPTVAPVAPQSVALRMLVPPPLCISTVGGYSARPGTRSSGGGGGSRVETRRGAAGRDW